MRPRLLRLQASRTPGPGPSRRALCSTADVSGSIGTRTCSTVAKGSHQKLSWKHDPRADHSGAHTLQSLRSIRIVATYTAVPSGVEGFFQVIAGQNVLEACGQCLSFEGWV